MIVYSYKLVFVTLSRTRNYFLGMRVCMNLFGISMHTGSPSKSNGSRQPPPLPSLNQAIENGLVIRHHAKSKTSSIRWIVSKDQKVTGNLPFLSDKHTSSKPALHSTTL